MCYLLSDEEANGDIGMKKHKELLMQCRVRFYCCPFSNSCGQMRHMALSGHVTETLLL